MSPQIDSFDDVQCEEFTDSMGCVWDMLPHDDSFIGLPELPEQHPCLVDEFQYSHNFAKNDIAFICDYQQIRNWGTPGYYALLRDLLTSGF